MSTPSWPAVRRCMRPAMSSKARGLGPDDLGDLPVTMAPPDRLVELTFEADRVLVY